MSNKSTTILSILAIILLAIGFGIGFLTFHKATPKSIVAEAVVQNGQIAGFTVNPNLIIAAIFPYGEVLPGIATSSIVKVNVSEGN